MIYSMINSVTKADDQGLFPPFYINVADVLRDSHCSCGHFEMRLTYVGHSVQKLWAFFKEYFIGDMLPLVCL